jgi:hypothetical protein
MSRLKRAAAALGWLMACVGLHAHAQNPAATDAARLPALPPFHRTFIPADEVRSQAWTGGYLPVDSAEFERLLEVVQTAATGAPARSAEIESGQYSAQLIGEDLLVGTGTMRLARRSEGPSSLPLDPFNLALSGARWSDEGGKPAVLGTGPDGKVRALVEGTQLECDWSLRGVRTSSGAVAFALELPNCPMARFTLDAPAAFDVVADQGIVSKSAAAEPETIRWTIELGGHRRVNLKVVPENVARQRRPLTLLRQAISYKFSTRGINVLAQLKLDVHGEPLERIAVDLDPSLRLVAASYGELEIPWSATADVETRMIHVVLQLPEPILGTGRVLQLSAMAPLVSGKEWRLPALRPQGVSWQEGTAELLLPSSFALERLKTDGCRQSRIAALPAPLAGESIEIQYYRPGATIDVLVAQPRERLKVESGALVDVGPNEMTSLCALQLTLARGQRRAAQIGVQSGWTIDSVESMDSNLPVNWELDETTPQQTALSVRFEAAISSDKPARILIRGHRALPAGSSFEGRQMEMLSFDSFQSGTRLIGVRAAEGSELRWSALEDLNRLDPLKLSPTESKLFSQPPTGLVFVEDPVFAQAGVTLQRRKASYSVDVRIDAAVQKNVLTETYTIECVPEVARVDRLLVHLSHPRESNLEWNLAGGNSGQFSARKMSTGEQARTALPPEGEVWELNLQLVRPGAFELRGVRSTPLARETPISLASVADAATQRGTLAIRALGDSGLSIKNRRLVPVPAELLDSDRYQTARATYHYQPSRDDLGPEPAVSIVPTSVAQAESGAWAWNNQLDTRYAPDGSSVHWSSFQIQTAGRQQLQLSLPDRATLQAAWIDNQRISSAATSSPEKPLRVELPSGKGFATVSLYFSTPDSLPFLTSSFQPPFPQLDIPVLARKWSIWLPPGYSVAGADSAYTTDSLTPLTWSQRLFGVLGRGNGQKLFNPLASADWRAAWGPSERQRSSQAADPLIQNLGTIAAEYAGGEGLSWGQLLSLCAQVEAQPRRMLLVDPDGLERLGVTTQARVRLQAGDTPWHRGHAILQQSGLVLLTDGASLILTSAASAAGYAGQLSPSDEGVVRTLLPGPLADETHRASSRGDWSRFETIESWRSGPAGQPSPWRNPSLTGDFFDGAQGWSACTLRLAQPGNPAIRVVQTAAMSSLAWAVFLSITGLGMLSGKARPVVLIGLVASGACAALVLPAVYAPLASAVFLAAAVCLAIGLTRATRPQPAKNDQSHGSRRVRSSVVHELSRMILVAALIHLSLAVYAAAPPADPQLPQPEKSSNAELIKPPPSVPATSLPSVDASAAKVSTEKPTNAIPQPATPPIHRVYVPTDDRQNPVGDKYYVPEEFYRQLHRLAAQASDEPRDWLITRARYQGTLARDAISNRLGVAQFKATFDLQVLQNNVTVRIPLSREGLARAIVGARLEGRSIPLTWSDAGDALLVKTSAADRYRLELDLKPPLQTDASTAGFELMIPALASATLDLSFPPDAPAIELPTARGRIQMRKDRGEFSASLGSSDRLSVRWPIAGGMEGAAANLDVEELIWVKVRPGTTVVDAKFKYRVLGGRVQQIRLLTDPRLRLLPSLSERSPIAAVHTVPGDPQKIELELARPVSDQVTIDLSFLVTNTSGVGNLRLPRLESSGARAAKRWLAVTVDAALQPKIQAGEDSRTIDIPEFSAAWGSAETRPQAAYAIPRGEPVWVLATQPKEPRTTVEQTLAFSLGRTSALVQLDANLSISDGHLLQLGLQGPRGLTVESVSLREDESQRVTRWAADQDGRITVFLNNAIDGRQRLTLRGRWNVVHADAFALPHVDVLAAEVKKRQVHLYRQPGVLASIQKTSSVGDVNNDDLQLENFGTLLGKYSIDDPTAVVTVTLAPNVVKSQAVAATFLQRDADRWVADFHYHIEVLEGIVDTLQFEIPAQRSEPLRIEPTANFKIVPVPGEQRRQLIVYPRGPISGKYQLKIRGRVALSAGDRLRAPDILPLRNQQIERFVVLPQSLDLQQVTWDTFGLSRAQLPPELAGDSPHVQSPAIYQVLGERFQASLKAVERISATARVALADIHAIWQSPDRCQSVAVFDVEPGGATGCILELPAECVLLHASNESVPAQLASLGANRWRLTFESRRLPQRIELVYEGPLGGAAKRRKFQSPRLVDLEVARTLWTVYGPPRAGLGQANTSAATATSAEQETQRLKSINGLVQLSAEVIGEHLPEEIVRWYRPWKSRYATARAALDRELASKHQTKGPTESDNEVREVDKQILAVDSRLGAASPQVRQVALPPPASELLSSARANLLPTRCAIAGQAHDLELRYPQASSDGFWPRLFSGLAIVLAGASVWFLVRGRSLPKFAPAVVAAGVAVAWWLFLVPSLLGLLVLVATSWAVFRTKWQTTAARAPSN